MLLLFRFSIHSWCSRCCLCRSQRSGSTVSACWKRIGVSCWSQRHSVQCGPKGFHLWYVMLWYSVLNEATLGGRVEQWITHW